MASIIEAVHVTQEQTLHTSGRRPQGAYLGIFAVSFALLFVIALVGETLGLPWRSWMPGAEGVSSLAGGVKRAVYTFMSYLT